MLLLDLVIIFLFSLFALVLSFWLRLPSLVGFLLTGVLIGPSGLGLVPTVAEIEPIAEIGLILLLFTVGMEFSPRLLRALKRPFLLGGSLYVFLMIIVGFFAALIYGREIHEALFLGFLLSLSSTAIVSKLLIEEGDLSRERGQVAMAILIFQDFVAILMVLTVPLLSSVSEFTPTHLLLALLKSLFLLFSALFLSKYAMPHLLRRIAKEKSRELLLISLLAVCFSVVWISGKMGLSLSMGAFLAGIVLSFGEYRHHTVGTVLPFQDIFTHFFFISLGMLVNLDYFWLNMPLILLISSLVVVAKTAVGFLSSRALSLTLGASLFVALSLAEIGEFSFVLLKEGLRYNIGEIYLHQLFLSVAIVTMALAPLLCHLGRLLSRRVSAQETVELQREKFAFIAGFGGVGKRIVSSLKKRGINTLVVDLDPEIAEEEREVPIIFGDAANPHLLRRNRISEALFAVIAVESFEEEVRILSALREISSSLPIFVRTESVANESQLVDLGATAVVVDERESYFALLKLIQ